MKTKKLAALLLAATLLAACGGEEPKGLGAVVSAPPEVVSVPAAQSGTPGEAAETGLPPLRVLMSSFIASGDDPDGFYMIDLPQNDRYCHLMYYDYHTLQQRYVCDEPGCDHSDESCTAAFRYAGGTYAFAQGDYLFIFFQAYDDGTGLDNRENWPSALVRYNRDATDPHVMMSSYEPYPLLLDSVYGDGEALYFTNTEVGFVRLDVESFEKTVLLPADWRKSEETGVRVQAFSTYGGQLLCRRYRMEDPNEPWEMLDMYRLEPRTGVETPLHSFPDKAGWPRGFTPEGVGYYIDPPTGEIRSLNPETGEDVLVSDMLCAQNTTHTRTEYVGETEVEVPFYSYEGWSILPSGDWLIMQGYDAAADDQATLSYNLKTGESHPVTFTNYFNGSESSMFILTDTPHGLLVLEDRPQRTMYSTGTGGDPTSFRSEYWVFALIAPEDFAQNIAKFRTIQPVAYSGAWQ